MQQHGGRAKARPADPAAEAGAAPPQANTVNADTEKPATGVDTGSAEHDHPPGVRPAPRP